MALSYEFSIGSVRAKENALFSKTDLEQLLGCKTTAELCQTLSDKGYGTVGAFDEMTKRHMDGVWEYLRKIAPDFGVFSPFLIQNDVHNFKVVLKGTMSARDYYTALLLTPCTVEHKLMIDAVEHRIMKDLPAWLQEPAAMAYDLLAHTGDARAADAVLDKAVMLEMLRQSEGFRSKFLKEYFRTEVFYHNIKIALRGARTGADRHYYKSAMPRFEGFDRDKIVQAALKGHDALVDMLSKLSDYGCKQAMEQYKSSPSAFEK
ncbi:MAG: V-type ATPase subunit, partial [Ruminococcus sp.]|nr:V-type ATPase subunit [Ruminococcus sp.]